MKHPLTWRKAFLSCIIVAPLILFGSLQADAQLQGQHFIDSLLKELPKQKDDTNKVKMLNNVSAGYSTIDPDEGIKYGQQGLSLAEKLQWKKGMASANRSLAFNSSSKSDYPKTLEYFSTALKIYEDIDDKAGAASITGNLGNLYTLQGDYVKALDYDFKALKMHEEVGNKSGVASVTGNIGNLYNYESNYPKALEYFFKALKMDEEMGNKGYAASVTGNIGIVYAEQKDYANALDYSFKALKINEELGNKGGIANVTGTIGNMYKDQGDYPKALEYLYKGLKMTEDMGDRQSAANITETMGDVFTEQKNYAMAIAYGQKALKMNEEIGEKRQAVFTMMGLGNVYLAMVEDTVKAVNKVAVASEAPAGSYIFAGSSGVSIPSGKSARLGLAKSYFIQAKDSAYKINTPDVVQDCYESLAKIYGLGGDYRRAMESYQHFMTIKDSIFSKENEKKMIHTAMQYDYDKKHLADSLKNAEKEKITGIELQRQRSYTYMGIAGALLLLGFSFVTLKNNKLLGNEKKRSEDLLLNILPSEVAEELKATGSAAAKHYSNVTVLFTDFVNFTKASEKLSPQALIDELHICFKTFDEITAKYNIEKIKTIGDAYLAVCGLPVADARHAENIVGAAIEISNFMGDRYAKLGDRTFEVRIGIHSGSVVAGIVGVKKFAYDIWGDTVNTAARMEQNSEAGKINISQVTYELVKDKFACVYRGEIDAKNKGMLKMYYLSAEAFSA